MCALLIRWWIRRKHASTADPISSPMISLGSTTSTVTASPAPPQTTPLLSSRHAELRRRLLVTLVTVSFYYYPSLLTTSLSLFACYRIDPLEAQMGQSYPLNAQACPSTFYVLQVQTCGLVMSHYMYICVEKCVNMFKDSTCILRCLCAT